MNAGYSEMSKLANGPLSRENSRWFLAMAEYYASDPGNILKESNLTKSLRSLDLLSSNVFRNTLNERLASFRVANDHPYPFLPSPAELQEELIPITSEIRSQYPYITTNLNLSQPTSSHDLVSMNVLVRLYDARQSQKIKIKLGSFQDEMGRLFWEVGFVYLDKSIRQPLPKLLDQRAAGDYFLLKDLVDCTKRFIVRRERVVGLDITPAYYHVVLLCKRMGGVAEDEATLNRHLNEIHDAFQRYLEDGQHLNIIDPSHKRRLAISWLLEKRLLRNPSGKSISWHPPRLIWKSPCSSIRPQIQLDQNSNGVDNLLSGQARPAFDNLSSQAQT
jgi:hypothetical protein